MAQYDLNLREYWRIVKKRRLMILVTLVLTAVFSTFFAFLSKPAPIYKATASVRLERVVLAGVSTEVRPWVDQDMLATQAAVIKSPPVIDRAAKMLGLVPAGLTSEEIRVNKEYLATVVGLRSKLECDYEANLGIINIHAKSEDSKQAMRLANTVAEAYREERLQELIQRSSSQRTFIDSQLSSARESLSKSEEDVRDFKEKNKIVSLEAQSASLLQQSSMLQASYDKATVVSQKIAEVKRVLEHAQTSPLGSKTSFYFEEAPPTYRAFNDKLVNLMLERDTLMLTYTERYPQVVEIRKQISEIVTAMKAQLHALEAGLREEIRGLRAKIDDINGQLKELPDKGLAMKRLERQSQQKAEIASLLERKNQEAAIQAAERLETVQIVRPALEPDKPSNPPKTLQTALAGLLIGLILGIAMAFLAEMFDTSLGAIEEIEALLGVPVMGLVPHVSLQEIKESLKEKYSMDVEGSVAERAARLIAHFAPESRMAESYRAIRTNLAFACQEQDIRTVVLTSTSPEEGKTTTVVNLALTLAQAGKKILLVEGDLRKPMISRLFGIEHIPGVSDVLLGGLEWRKTVRTISDIMTGALSTDDILRTPGIENLHILPSGTLPPNPAEIVYSKAIGQLLGQMKEAYDLILIDAPPLLAATDAALLSTKADAVVLVYRVGKIPRGMLKRAKAQLDNVRAKLIGVVLNGLRAELSTDFAEYRYKYYYYYRRSGPGDEQRPWDRVEGLPALLRNTLGNLGAKGGLSPRKILAGLSGRRGKRAQDRATAKGARKRSLVKNGLLLVALVLLLFGILYQMGYLRFAPAEMSTTEIPVSAHASGQGVSAPKQAPESAPDSTAKTQPGRQ